MIPWVFLWLVDIFVHQTETMWSGKVDEVHDSGYFNLTLDWINRKVIQWRLLHCIEFYCILKLWSYGRLTILHLSAFPVAIYAIGSFQEQVLEALKVRERNWFRCTNWWFTKTSLGRETSFALPSISNPCCLSVFLAFSNPTSRAHPQRNAGH